MIKLTNNSPPWQGLIIYVNSDHIVSVFEEPMEEGGSLQTRVLLSLGTLYTVEESMEEVVRLVKRYNGVV